MIDLNATGISNLNGSGIDNFANISNNDIEKFDFMVENEIEGGSIEMMPTAQQKSLGEAAMDYMLSNKNSLIDKSKAIHESYLGDDNFSFQDKMQLLEKTYNYQLEMTFYNTFMSQTLQKADALIQLK